IMGLAWMKTHLARVTIALCISALWPIPSQAQYWKAAQAWRALGPQVLQCLRTTLHIHGVLLGRQEGIYPNNRRVWSSVYYCERAVGEAHPIPLHPPVPPPPTASPPSQGGQPPQGAESPPAPGSEPPEQDQPAPNLGNPEKEKKKTIDALWRVFRNKTVNPNDKIAALLNYSSFGSDSGPPDSFWAPKPGIGEVYVEYKKGHHLQEYESAVDTVNLSKIDPAQFFVKEGDDLVEIVAAGKTLFRCSGCNRAELQERWLTYFSGRGR
ncbi:MAG TPA: hypothetical protein VGR89_02715, partial [Puia sp.]|nr:hypothetical protein [Puia sp.]